MSAPPDAVQAIPLATTRRDVMRVVWALAWPTIMTFGLDSLVGLVDTLMVGRLGAVAVAGVGVGTQILNVLGVVNIALATGTVALVARHVGAVEREAAEDALEQSAYIGLVLGVAIAVPVWVWAPELVAIYRVDPPVVEAGAAFVRTVVLGLPAMALFAVIGAGLRGAGDMRTPLAIGVLVNALNVSAAYVLIFGKLGFPAMGIRGAALASALAFVAGALIGLVHLRRGDSALRFRGLPRPDFALWRRVAAVGGPAGLEQLLVQIGILIYLGLTVPYGTSAVAAYFIGVRIMALSYLPGFGFGAAAATIVGQQLGAGQPQGAARGGWEANRLAVWAMSVAGLVLFVTARPIAALFVDDQEVIAAAVSFIRMLAAAQPLMAADCTLGGALRGAGDTRFALLSVMLGFYGMRLGLAWAAAEVFGLPLAWVWAALLGDYLVRATLKAWRFSSGRWSTAVRVD